MVSKINTTSIPEIFRAEPVSAAVFGACDGAFTLVFNAPALKVFAYAVISSTEFIWKCTLGASGVPLNQLLPQLRLLSQVFIIA